MLRKVNLLKLNFGDLNRSCYSLITLNKRFRSNIIGSEFIDNVNLTIKRNYPFYNKLTIKAFTKKANRRKGEEVKSSDNGYNNHKKKAKKINNEIKGNLLGLENLNESEAATADLEDEDVNIKENNKNQIRAADLKNSNKLVNNEELNSEKKSLNDRTAEELLKCMIIHPVFSDR